MLTTKISRIFLLLVLSTLATSQELVEPSTFHYNGIINCNGKIAVCVGPLTYKDCLSNGRGTSFAMGDAKRCPPNSRCINDGVEICVPLKTETDAPTAEPLLNTATSTTKPDPTTEGPSVPIELTSSQPPQIKNETTSNHGIPASEQQETTDIPVKTTTQSIVPQEDIVTTTLEPQVIIDENHKESVHGEKTEHPLSSKSSEAPVTDIESTTLSEAATTLYIDDRTQNSDTVETSTPTDILDSQLSTLSAANQTDETATQNPYDLSSITSSPDETLNLIEDSTLLADESNYLTTNSSIEQEQIDVTTAIVAEETTLEPYNPTTISDDQTFGQDSTVDSTWAEVIAEETTLGSDLSYSPVESGTAGVNTVSDNNIPNTTDQDNLSNSEATVSPIEQGSADNVNKPSNSNSSSSPSDTPTQNNVPNSEIPTISTAEENQNNLQKPNEAKGPNAPNSENGVINNETDPNETQIVDGSTISPADDSITLDSSSTDDPNAWVNENNGQNPSDNANSSGTTLYPVIEDAVPTTSIGSNTQSHSLPTTDVNASNDPNLAANPDVVDQPLHSSSSAQTHPAVSVNTPNDPNLAIDSNPTEQPLDVIGSTDASIAPSNTNAAESLNPSKEQGTASDPNAVGTENVVVEGNPNTVSDSIPETAENSFDETLQPDTNLPAESHPAVSVNIPNEPNLAIDSNPTDQPLDAIDSTDASTAATNTNTAQSISPATEQGTASDPSFIGTENVVVGGNPDIVSDSIPETAENNIEGILQYPESSDNANILPNPTAIPDPNAALDQSSLGSTDSNTLVNQGGSLSTSNATNTLTSSDPSTQTSTDNLGGTNVIDNAIPQLGTNDLGVAQNPESSTDPINSVAIANDSNINGKDTTSASDLVTGNIPIQNEAASSAQTGSGQTNVHLDGTTSSSDHTNSILNETGSKIPHASPNASSTQNSLSPVGTSLAGAAADSDSGLPNTTDLNSIGAGVDLSSTTSPLSDTVGSPILSTGSSHTTNVAGNDILNGEGAAVPVVGSGPNTDGASDNSSQLSNNTNIIGELSPDSTLSSVSAPPSDVSASGNDTQLSSDSISTNSVGNSPDSNDGTLNSSTGTSQTSNVSNSSNINAEGTVIAEYPVAPNAASSSNSNTSETPNSIGNSNTDNSNANLNDDGNIISNSASQTTQIDNGNSISSSGVSESGTATVDSILSSIDSSNINADGSQISDTESGQSNGIVTPTSSTDGASVSHTSGNLSLNQNVSQVSTSEGSLISNEASNFNNANINGGANIILNPASQTDPIDNGNSISSSGVSEAGTATADSHSNNSISSSVGSPNINADGTQISGMESSQSSITDNAHLSGNATPNSSTASTSVSHTSSSSSLNQDDSQASTSEGSLISNETSNNNNDVLTSNSANSVQSQISSSHQNGSVTSESPILSVDVTGSQNSNGSSNLNSLNSTSTSTAAGNWNANADGLPNSNANGSLTNPNGDSSQISNTAGDVIPNEDGAEIANTGSADVSNTAVNSEGSTISNQAGDLSFNHNNEGGSQNENPNSNPNLNSASSAAQTPFPADSVPAAVNTNSDGAPISIPPETSNSNVDSTPASSADGGIVSNGLANSNLNGDGTSVSPNSSHSSASSSLNADGTVISIVASSPSISEASNSASTSVPTSNGQNNQISNGASSGSSNSLGGQNSDSIGDANPIENNPNLSISSPISTQTVGPAHTAGAYKPGVGSGLSGSNDNPEKAETAESESVESKEPKKEKPISNEDASAEDKSQENAEKKKEEERKKKEEEREKKEEEKRRKEEEKRKKEEEKKKREEEKREEEKKKKEEEREKKEEEKKKHEEEKRKKEEEKKKKEEEKKKIDEEKEEERKKKAEEHERKKRAEEKHHKDKHESGERSSEEESRKYKELREELVKKLHKIAKHEKCDEGDVYPDVKDCNKYYRCIEKSDKTKLAHLHCEDDKRFDFEEKKCLRKTKAKCLAKDE